MHSTAVVAKEIGRDGAGNPCMKVQILSVNKFSLQKFGVEIQLVEVNHFGMIQTYACGQVTLLNEWNQQVQLLEHIPERMVIGSVANTVQLMFTSQFFGTSISQYF
jgi:hypothetical protein